MNSRRSAPNRAVRTCIAVALSALLIPAATFAQGKPPNAGGGSGGGNKPPTEASFSLSVPAIIAGGPSKFVLNCPSNAWSMLTAPIGDPKWYDAACAETQEGLVCVDAGYYYVQRDAAWQAPCTTTTASPVAATGAWGDNLAGAANLKVGSPIRVEFVLWDASGLAGGQQGYNVIKLEPAELDRVSDYGHRAEGGPGAFSAVPTDLGAVVHDPTATLRIEQVGGAVVFEGVAGSEINSTGKIVYGYNLRVSDAGDYLITYTLPNVSLTGCDVGDCGGTTAKLQITVGTGGGGGGGKGGGQGGGKPVKP